MGSMAALDEPAHRRRREHGEDLVHPDPRSVMLGEITLEMSEIDEFNLNSIRRDILHALPDERLTALHTLVKLGAFSCLDRMFL